nr:MAG TPA: hypothetical protein [Caudoviricetes sp.]
MKSPALHNGRTGHKLKVFLVFSYQYLVRDNIQQFDTPLYYKPLGVYT